MTDRTKRGTETAPTDWQSQLDDPALEVRVVAEGRKKIPAGKLMLFPSGRAIAELIGTIPAGQTMTPKELRTALAAKYEADITCPVTASARLQIVAEAAFEAFTNGASIDEITPIWRVMDAKTPALKRCSFDPAFVLDRRAEEAEGEASSR